MVGRLRDTFLFDLDGTLLPLDMDEFLKLYYIGINKRRVCNSISETHGNEIFDKAVRAMMGNDGSMTNRQMFFKTLYELSGKSNDELETLMYDFYENEFNDIKDCTEVEEKAVEIIKVLKEKGYRLVLATNPLFPPIATNKRIEWGGLRPDDFEHITYYDNSSYCKPRHGYFKEIVDKLGICTEQCYMVGNDVRDDMSAVEPLGMEGFLVTDHLIGDIGKVPQCRKGDYSELLDFVRKLPQI